MNLAQPKNQIRTEGSEVDSTHVIDLRRIGALGRLLGGSRIVE
jgi:hypothetical protein